MKLYYKLSEKILSLIFLAVGIGFLISVKHFLVDLWPIKQDSLTDILLDISLFGFLLSLGLLMVLLGFYGFFPFLKKLEKKKPFLFDLVIEKILAGLFVISFSGLLIAVGLSMFKTSDLVDASPFWSMIIKLLLSSLMIFFAGKLLYEVIFKQPKDTCQTCGKKSLDVLMKDGGKKTETYCRQHLLDQFKFSFQQHPNKIVVFEFDEGRCGLVYGYYPVSLMEKFNFQKQDIAKIKSLLLLIQGKCENCQNEKAGAAYFKKEDLPWDEGGPLMSQVTCQPGLFCRKCALERLIPLLSGNKIFFKEGLYVPYKEEGVFISTCI